MATWNGEDGNIYCNKSLSVDATVKALHPRTLGDDLDAHVKKGGIIIGHNIKAFDLPVLRDALDCWTAGDMLKTESVIDTKNLVNKAAMTQQKVMTSLKELVKHTLSDNKLMNSEDAPKAWRQGKYDEVAKYCLSDAQLTYDLYQFGKSEGYVRSSCRHGRISRHRSKMVNNMSKEQDLGRTNAQMNIRAARTIADTVKSTLGPMGMDKMLVDGHGNVIVTNDGATILREVDVSHPGGKMIAEVAKTQENLCYDGTTSTVVLAGALLGNTESLFARGLHPNVICRGYHEASLMATTYLSNEVAMLAEGREEYLKIAPHCDYW